MSSSFLVFFIKRSKVHQIKVKSKIPNSMNHTFRNLIKIQKKKIKEGFGQLLLFYQ